MDLDEDDFQAAWVRLLGRGETKPDRALFLTVVRGLASNRRRDQKRRAGLDLTESRRRTDEPSSPSDVAEARRVLRLLARYAEGRQLIQDALGLRPLGATARFRLRERLAKKGLQFPAELVEESRKSRRIRG